MEVWRASCNALEALARFFFDKLNNKESLFGFIDWFRFAHGLVRRGLGHLNMGAEWTFRDLQFKKNWNGRPQLTDCVQGVVDMLIASDDYANREATDLADCLRTSDISKDEEKAKAAGLELFRCNRVKLGTHVHSIHQVIAFDDVDDLDNAERHEVTDADTAHPRCSCSAHRHSGRASCKHHWAVWFKVQWHLDLLPNSPPYTGDILRQHTADATIARREAINLATGQKDFQASHVSDRKDPVAPCDPKTVPRSHVANENPTYRVHWPAGSFDDGTHYDAHSTWEPHRNVPWKLVKRRYPSDRHYYFKIARKDRSGRTGADSNGRVGRHADKAKRPGRTGQRGARDRSQKRQHDVD